MTTTFAGLRREREAERMLGLDQYTDAAEREMQRKQIIAQRLERKRYDMLQDTPEAPVVGEAEETATDPVEGKQGQGESGTGVLTRDTSQVRGAPQRRSRPDRQSEFSRGLKDFGLDTLEVLADVHDTLEGWRQEGRSAGDLWEDVKKGVQGMWENEAPFYRGPSPDKRIRKSPGLAERDENYFRRAVAYGRTMVPRTATPTTARALGYVAGEVAEAVAVAPLAATKKAFLAAEMAVATWQGIRSSEEHELELAKFMVERGSTNPVLTWLADRENDSPLVREGKEVIEHNAAALFGVAAVSGLMKLNGAVAAWRRRVPEGFNPERKLDEEEAALRAERAMLAPGDERGLERIDRRLRGVASRRRGERERAAATKEKVAAGTEPGKAARQAEAEAPAPETPPPAAGEAAAAPARAAPEAAPKAETAKAAPRANTRGDEPLTQEEVERYRAEIQRTGGRYPRELQRRWKHMDWDQKWEEQNRLTPPRQVIDLPEGRTAMPQEADWWPKDVAAGGIGVPRAATREAQEALGRVWAKLPETDKRSMHADPEGWLSVKYYKGGPAQVEALAREHGIALEDLQAVFGSKLESSSAPKRETNRVRETAQRVREIEWKKKEYYRKRREAREKGEDVPPPEGVAVKDEPLTAAQQKAVQRTDAEIEADAAREAQIDELVERLEEARDAGEDALAMRLEGQLDELLETSPELAGAPQAADAVVGAGEGAPAPVQGTGAVGEGMGARPRIDTSEEVELGLMASIRAAEDAGDVRAMRNAQSELEGLREARLLNRVNEAEAAGDAEAAQMARDELRASMEGPGETRPLDELAERVAQESREAPQPSKVELMSKPAPASRRTPDVDRAEAEQGDATVRTLADRPPEGELPPKYTRPLDQWDEVERSELDDAVKRAGWGAVHVTKEGGAAVRLGTGQVHPLIGENVGTGMPMFRAEPLRPDEVEPLAQYRARRATEARLEQMAAEEAEEAQRGLVEQGTREWQEAQRARTGEMGAELERGTEARAAAEAAFDEQAAGRLVDAEAREAAIEEVSRSVKRALDDLADTKTADVFTTVQTSPAVLARAAVKALDTTKRNAGIAPARTGVHETSRPVPLKASPALRGGSPEDMPFSRETLDEMPELTKDQVKRFHKVKDRDDAIYRKEGEERPFDPAGPVPRVEAIDARVKQISEEPDLVKDTATRGPDAHRKDVAVLRKLAGEIGHDETTMTAAQARAWVQMLTHKANRVRDVSAEAMERGGDQAGWQDAWRGMQEIEEYRAMILTLKGNRSQAAKRLAGIDMPTRYSIEGRKGLSEEMKRQMIDMQEARVRAMAQSRYGSMDELVKTVQSVARQDSLDGVANVARYMPTAGQKLRGIGERIQRWALNGMVAGPKTMAMAAVSNVMVSVTQVPEMFIAAGIKPLMKSDGELVTWRAAQADMKGRIPGLIEGIKMAGAATEAGFTGGQRGMQRLREQGLMERYRQLTRSERVDTTDMPPGLGLEVNPSQTMAEKMATVTDRVLSAPSTLLNALDLMAKGAAFQSYIARRAAMAVDAERLSGQAAVRRERELLEDPPEDWIEEAVRNAEDMTFTRQYTENERWMLIPMAKLTRAIDSLPPFGRLLAAPFLTVTTRSLSYAIDRIPVVALAQRRVMADIQAGGVRRQMAVTRQIAGTMWMTGFFLASGSGIITGGGTDNPKHRRGAAKVRPPYSIRVGDGWYEYDRLDPLGRLMGVAADAAEIMSFAEDARVVMEAGDMMGMAVASVQHHMTEGSFMGGVQEFAEIVMDATANAEKGFGVGASAAVGKFIGGAAWSAVPLNNLVRAGGRGGDPVYRDSRAVAEEGEVMKAFFDGMTRNLRAQVPGLSADLPASIDAYGRERTRMSPTFEGSAPAGLGWSLLSPVAYHEDTNDPGYKAMLDAEWAPPPWPKASGGVPYSPNEREALAKVSGALFRRELGNAISWGQFASLRKIVRDESLPRETRQRAQKMMADRISAIWSASLAQGRKAVHSLAEDWQVRRAEAGIANWQETENVMNLQRMQQ